MSAFSSNTFFLIITFWLVRLISLKFSKKWVNDDLTKLQSPLSYSHQSSSGIQQQPVSIDWSLVSARTSHWQFWPAGGALEKISWTILQRKGKLETPHNASSKRKSLLTEQVAETAAERIFKWLPATKRLLLGVLDTHTGHPFSGSSLNAKSIKVCTCINISFIHLHYVLDSPGLSPFSHSNRTLWYALRTLRWINWHFSLKRLTD